MNQISFKKLHTYFDPLVFYGSSAALCLIFLLSVFKSDLFSEKVFLFKSWLLNYFGWFYSLSLILILISVTLIFFLFGHVRIGGAKAKKDFSTLSWLAMLFSAGIGTGLVYSGTFEPMSHYLNAPHLEHMTGYAKYLAAQDLTLFHWGVPAWAIYSLCGLMFALYGFNLNKGFQFSQFITNKRLKPLVNVFSILSIMAGLSTTFAIASGQIQSGVTTVFPEAAPFLSNFIIIALITFLSTLSLLSGLQGGIRHLSLFNMFLVGLLFFYVLSQTSALSYLISNFEILFLHGKNFSRSLFIDPFRLSKDWLGSWSILYWAWWVSWTPFVGLFIAKISKGRTIREFLFFTIAAPSFISFLWFSLFGFAGYEFQSSGLVDFSFILQDSPHKTLFALLGQTYLPLAASLLSVVSVTIFYITSSDSGSYVVDMISKNSTNKESLGLKVYWAAMEGLLALSLLYYGGLNVIKSLIIIFSLPTLVYLLFGAAKVFLYLWAHHRKRA